MVLHTSNLPCGVSYLPPFSSTAMRKKDRRAASRRFCGGLGRSLLLKAWNSNVAPHQAPRVRSILVYLLLYHGFHLSCTLLHLKLCVLFHSARDIVYDAQRANVCRSARVESESEERATRARARAHACSQLVQA